jgi:hypothetical protein
MSFEIRAAVDGCGTHQPGWHPGWPPSGVHGGLQAAHPATTRLEPGDKLCPPPHPWPWTQPLGQVDHQVLSALGVSHGSAANPGAERGIIIIGG